MPPLPLGAGLASDIANGVARVPAEGPYRPPTAALPRGIVAGGEASTLWKEPCAPAWLAPCA